MSSALAYNKKTYIKEMKKYTKTIKNMSKKEVNNKLNSMGLLDKNGKVKKKICNGGYYDKRD